jgi:DNA polymerase I-like protein with 3'-5' exonuclease and polymerase domains
MKYAIRSVFIPPPDYLFVAFDLSQAESWASAYLSGEETFKDNLKNRDCHSATASIIFDIPYDTVVEEYKKIGSAYMPRYLGKKSNHGLTYQMGPEEFTEQINAESEETGIIVSLPQIKKIRTKWLEYYWKIPQWWRAIEAEIRATRILINPYGRKRTFMGFLNNQLFKEATAFVPQSTVADHAFGRIQQENPIPGGMLFIRDTIKRNNIPARLCHTAYDSCMYEVHKAAVTDFIPMAYKAMHRPVIINGEECLIPVDGEMGDRWGELSKIPKDMLS